VRRVRIRKSPLCGSGRPVRCIADPVRISRFCRLRRIRPNGPVRNVPIHLLELHTLLISACWFHAGIIMCFQCALKSSDIFSWSAIAAWCAASVSRSGANVLSAKSASIMRSIPWRVIGCAVSDRYLKRCVRNLWGLSIVSVQGVVVAVVASVAIAVSVIRRWADILLANHLFLRCRGRGIPDRSCWFLAIR